MNAKWKHDEIKGKHDYDSDHRMNHPNYRVHVTGTSYLEYALGRLVWLAALLRR